MDWGRFDNIFLGRHNVGQQSWIPRTHSRECHSPIGPNPLVVPAKFVDGLRTMRCWASRRKWESLVERDNQVKLHEEQPQEWQSDYRLEHNTRKKIPCDLPHLLPRIHRCRRESRLVNRWMRLLLHHATIAEFEYLEFCETMRARAR